MAFFDFRVDTDQGLRDLAARTGLPFNQITGDAARGFFGALGTLSTGINSAPVTKVQTSHAFALKTAKGRTIGAVYGFNTDEARDVEDVWEVNANARGRPRAQVRQGLTGRTIRIMRYELYRKRLKELFGTTEWNTIADQVHSFRLREFWRAPSGIFSSGQTTYEYVGCDFTDVGRELDAHGDRVVRVSGTIKWVDRRSLA